MNRLVYPRNKSSKYTIIGIVYAIYVVVFAMLRGAAGVITGALSVVPVIGASWYFGFRGGLLVASLCILNNTLYLFLKGNSSFIRLLLGPVDVVGFFILAFVAFVVSNLKIVIDERSTALRQLEQYEK